MKGIKTVINYGDVYGDLTLSGKSENRKGIRYVEAICRCGNHFYTQLSRVKDRRVKSCGCMREFFNRQQATKHGFATKGNIHPIYNSYKGMKDRCYKPKVDNKKYYFDKNIKVCKEWMDNFQSFYDWSIINGWENGLSIDRIDGDKDYCPENCRWATTETQSRNRDFNINITAFNETKCLNEWFKDDRCCVTATTIRNRMKAGMQPEKAITLKRNEAA